MSDQTPPPVPPLPPTNAQTPPDQAGPDPYAATAVYGGPDSYAAPAQYAAPNPYAAPGQYAPTQPYPGPTAPYAAPYAAPQYPEYAAAVSTPPPAGSRTLGLIALVLAIVAAIVPGILGGIGSFNATLEAMRDAVTQSPQGLEDFDAEDLLAFLTPVREWVLLAEIGFWGGTVLGIWAIAQGIVAIAKRRGRGYGIAAVVVGVVASFVFAAVVYFAVIAGIVSGAAVAV